MFTESGTAATVLIVLLAVGILGWGFNRARPYGKLGILAWLQSVVLMAPWLIFFGLFAVGIYVNIVVILALLLVSVGVYIYLGKRLRAAGQEAIFKDKILQRLNQKQEQEATPQSPEASGENQQQSENSDSASEQGKKNLAPEMMPIPEEDLGIIRGIFGIDTFFATETISYQEGAIFRGNLRGEPEAVHEQLTTRLKERLGEKYRLFLVESPEEKPVVIVLPSSNDPQPASTVQKILALVLLVATVATTLEAIALLIGFDLFTNWERIREVLPLSVGIWLIIAAHEIAHRLVARRYQVKISFPFLIPSLQIGSFGGITRFESLLPNRTALFDIALAGPAAGGILSLVFLITGLILSHPGSQFQLPTQFLQQSVLVGSLAKVVLGSALGNALVDIHPLAIIGWLGLAINALNLMPAGQLDGGRIVQAIYGRKTARRTTIATLIILGIVAFTNPGNPLPLYWAILILFLLRNLERPSLNELTEPDDARAALGLLALFLMLATFIPLAPSLAGSLGIGS